MANPVCSPPSHHKTPKKSELTMRSNMATASAFIALYYFLGMLLISIATSEVKGQTVVQIHAKTADEDDAGMTRGTVDMELENMAGDACKITEMSSGSSDDYSRGEIGWCSSIIMQT